MPYVVPLDQARLLFPTYQFIKPLTPSEQKAAFHVRDQAGVDLCLKIISPNYEINRLSREIQALQSINHPNVVGLREYTYTSTPLQQRHYMVEEYVEGEDLTQKLIQGAAWAVKDLVSFFSQLFDGLSALEQKRVVHRDLKPNNIRVRLNGAPVIIDFGLARHLELPDLTLTADGAAIGTPKYFAPEQFIGTKHDIDRRTDLFAAGVVFYEAAIGIHPFWHPQIPFAELQEKVCKSDSHLDAKGFLGLPNQISMLIQRLLEKDRGRRPASAAQVSMMLNKLKGC